MSREQYRARSKKVQKLGRDGLVEQDKATGQEERISQRTADVSFGPERSLDQEAGRASSQRTPAQGGRRKQPRPALPSEPVQPIAGDVPDVTEIAPSMRQADDVPATTPMPKTDSASSSKRRQQKRANRLNPDAPAHPMGKDGADGGHLQFEPGHDPPSDTASPEPLPEEAEPSAPQSANHIPMRGLTQDGRRQPSPKRRIEGGGRLRFEADNPAAPDTRTQRTAEASPSGPEDLKQGVGPAAPMEPQSPGRSGGRLRFEAERPPSSTSPEARTLPERKPPHGGTSAVEPVSTPDTGLSRRQQNRYEKDF